MVLPKEMRLKGYKCFDYIHRTGYKFNSHLMLLKVAEANPKLLRGRNIKPNFSSCRCALSISNKVSKKAVLRNGIRRSLHEHLRKRFENKPEHTHKWLLLSLKPASINKTLLELQNECDKLLSKAGFYDG